MIMIKYKIFSLCLQHYPLHIHKKVVLSLVWRIQNPLKRFKFGYSFETKHVLNQHHSHKHFHLIQHSLKSLFSFIHYSIIFTFKYHLYNQHLQNLFILQGWIGNPLPEKCQTILNLLVDDGGLILSFHPQTLHYQFHYSLQLSKSISL